MLLNIPYDERGRLARSLLDGAAAQVERSPA